MWRVREKLHEQTESKYSQEEGPLRNSWTSSWRVQMRPMRQSIHSEEEFETSHEKSAWRHTSQFVSVSLEEITQAREKCDHRCSCKWHFKNHERRWKRPPPVLPPRPRNYIIIAQDLKAPWQPLHAEDLSSISVEEFFTLASALNSYCWGCEVCGKT